MLMNETTTDLPLEEALRLAQREAIETRQGTMVAYPHATASQYINYRGPDVEPFRAYLRWSANYVNVANIIARHCRKGRVPKLLAALERIVSVIEFENVVAPELAQHLIRHGFRPVAGGYQNDMQHLYERLRRVKGQDPSMVAQHPQFVPLPILTGAPGAAHPEAHWM